MNDLPEQDLRFRIFRLLDGELDQAEVAQLDAELRKDPEARRLYLEYAQLHSALESRCVARSQIGQSPLFSMEKLLARQRRRMMKGALLAAAAIVLISLTTLWLMVAQRRTATLARFEVAPNSDFSLTHSGEDHGPAANTLRAGSRLRLKSGVMEGKFGSGVRFVVEAPCDLRVLTEGRIAMDEGTGWFEVPSSAVGFTVETRRFTVVDLGTRFGIVARSGKGHEIHVAKGRVEVRAGEENKLILSAGQARRLDTDGKFTEIPVDSSRFATDIPLGARAAKSRLRILGKHPRKSQPRGLRHDPELGYQRGHCGFERHQPAVPRAARPQRRTRGVHPEQRRDRTIRQRLRFHKNLHGHLLRQRARPARCLQSDFGFA